MMYVFTVIVRPLPLHDLMELAKTSQNYEYVTKFSEGLDAIIKRNQNPRGYLTATDKENDILSAAQTDRMEELVRFINKAAMVRIIKVMLLLL